MTTVLLAFVLSAVLSLLLTPLVGKAGRKAGMVDFPGERKIHHEAIPRTGGVAILLASAVSLIALKFIPTKVTSLFVMDGRFVAFFIGGMICFGIGLVDDFHRLPPKLKFLFQIVAASIAFWGGIRIEHFSVFGISIDFGPFSYFFTVFWFILFINAVNLIDGLDGLAGGVIFFTAAVMVFLSVIGNNFLVAMLFAAIGGATLGFLRYNFTPASVFLGDSGSYFLGYLVAGLSVIGSFKSQVTAIMLIPILALGVPLYDTILSPIRRFLSGHRMFRPDAEHVHHRLLKLGFSTKRAVLLIYGITLFLCAVSIILVNIRDERAGLFLIVMGVAAIFFFRKLGYADQIYSSMISDWVEDLSDCSGFFGRDKRSFIEKLQEMMNSTNYEELWKNITAILDDLEFDKGSMYLNRFLKEETLKDEGRIVYISDHPERRRILPLNSSVILRKSPPELDWIRPPFDMENYVCSRSVLRIELPLVNESNIHFGTLVLVKDMNIKPINHQTLRRVEDLRRTVIRKMEMMTATGFPNPKHQPDCFS